MLIRFLPFSFLRHAFMSEPFRLRHVLLFLGLLFIAGFIVHYVVAGDRGLKRIQQLKREYMIVKSDWETSQLKNQILLKNIERLSKKTLDLDYLDERVRIVLGFVKNDEQVILLSK